MVGRFVEDEKVWLVGKHFDQLKPRLLSAREIHNFCRASTMGSNKYCAMVIFTCPTSIGILCPAYTSYIACSKVMVEIFGFHFLVILADAKTGCQFNLTVIDFAVGFSSLIPRNNSFYQCTFARPISTFDKHAMRTADTKCDVRKQWGGVPQREILHRHELMDAFITVVDGNLHIFLFELVVGL